MTWLRDSVLGGSAGACISAVFRVFLLCIYIGAGSIDGIIPEFKVSLLLFSWYLGADYMGILSPG